MNITSNRFSVLHNFTRLSELEDVRAIKYSYAIATVCFLAVFGFIGNIHILIIYIFKIKVKSTYHVLIVGLAVIDSLTCSITMPIDVLHLRYFFSFFNDIGCRTQEYSEYVLIISSLFITLVIAVDRYYKICLSSRTQLTCRHARYACGLAVVVAIVILAPVPVFSGMQDLDIQGSRVQFCSINNQYKDSPLPFASVAFINIVFYAITIIISFLHIRIARNLQKLRKTIKKRKPNTENSSESTPNNDGANVVIVSPLQKTMKVACNDDLQSIVKVGQPYSTAAISSLSLNEITTDANFLNTVNKVCSSVEYNSDLLETGKMSKQEEFTTGNTEKCVTGDVKNESEMSLKQYQNALESKSLVELSSDQENISSDANSISSSHNEQTSHGVAVIRDFRGETGSENVHYTERYTNCLDTSAVCSNYEQRADMTAKRLENELPDISPSDFLTLGFGTFDTKGRLNGKLLRQKRNRSVARICAAIAITCVISLLPGTIAIPMAMFKVDNAFVTLGIRAPFLRCLINPLIYGYFDRNCKRACKEIYRCSKVKN